MSHHRYARYLLPFEKDTSFRVVQTPISRPGTGITITHNNDYSRYAYDFSVPEGTLVTAAREGIVINIKDSFTTGSPNPSLSDKGNLVAIMHIDRSIAHYLHLAPRSVIVKLGQKVRAGDAIAYSGNTGYSYGPHLHFDVRRAAISKKGEIIHLSVPVDFYPRNGADEKILLRDGSIIKAQ
jgi:murein DD-endopeptidase MepM/ murein hydrolase activator NlpD